MSTSTAQVDRAFKALYDAGPIAIGPLLRELRLFDLGSLQVPNFLSLVSGLATILHDLSEEDSVDFITKALREPCHPAMESALRSIMRYRSSNYRISEFSGIPIFEERDLDRRYRATHYVCNWLRNVPQSDLKDISRIYIVKDLDSHDFSGQYQPHLAVITLVWISSFHPSNPICWLLRGGQERTLYHEIGHHHHKHVEYGEVPEQELQADAYADKLWFNAHPRFEKFVRILRCVRRRTPKSG